jgi:RimJ/RimL family protein N-acetyltransferase
MRADCRFFCFSNHIFFQKILFLKKAKVRFLTVVKNRFSNHIFLRKILFLKSFLYAKIELCDNKEVLMVIPVIETERLRLRGFEASDLDALAALNADERFVKYFGTGKPLTRYESWNVLAMIVGHWHLNHFGLWLVEDRITKEFIGRVGCWQPENWPGIEVAWGISPDYWGLGYATEAARASLQWGFSNLETDMFISVIHPENIASKRVAERIGERYAKTEPVNGKPSDIYAISRMQYETIA